jgi:surfactin synthase thioesterase subunit
MRDVDGGCTAHHVPQLNAPLDSSSCQPVTLMCIPPAGAGAAGFKRWAQHLPEWVTVMPAELPGREQHLQTRAFVRIADSAAHLYEQLCRVNPRRVAVFGYSMGALVAYELACLISAAGRSPLHLFVGACRAPNEPLRYPALHALKRDALIAELAKLGSEAVSPSSLEFFELVEPTLRADLHAAETYHRDALEPLACDITVVAGTDDPLAAPSCTLGWRHYTARTFTHHVVPGSHFFLYEREKEIISRVVTALSTTHDLQPGADGRTTGVDT